MADEHALRDKHGRLSLAEVGKRLGITGERVRQLLERALAKLRDEGIELAYESEREQDEEEQGAARERVRLPVIAGQTKLPL